MEELTLYLVHAWLHLAGLKDLDEEDRHKMRGAEAEQMEALEINLLQQLGFSNPYGND